MDTENALPQQKLIVGSTWHGFKILGKIGSGGMGTVYKAQQEFIDRIVALKILSPEKLSPSLAKRFKKEIELSARLHHPNIVQVYTADIHDGIPFIAMNYIEGLSFDQYLSQNPPLENSLKIMVLVAKAIHYAHRQDVVHRDLKPGNIFIDKEGHPFVMDFGIARSTKVEKGRLTKTGQILGTPQYMSPEQAQGRIRDLDIRTDVYSLGAVLYEIITGRPPFSGNSPLAILFQVVKQSPIKPCEINAQIPRETGKNSMESNGSR